MKSIRNSWELTKMSFSVLRKDTRIFLVQIGTLLVLGTIYVALGYFVYNTDGVQQYLLNDTAASTSLTVSMIAVFIGAYVFGMLVFYFSQAYIAVLVLATIRNQPVTIDGAMVRVHQNARALIQFTLLSSTVGIILQALEDRLPWAGSLASLIAQGAWNLATVFAVMTIVNGEAHTGIEATKRSVSILKNSFGENIVVRIGVGSLLTLAMLAWFSIGIFASILAANAGMFVVTWTILGAAFLGLLAFMLLSAALSSVLTVMLYEYVAHGGNTSEMHKELFKSMITPKRVYGIFNHS